MRTQTDDNTTTYILIEEPLLFFNKLIPVPTSYPSFHKILQKWKLLIFFLIFSDSKLMNFLLQISPKANDFSLYKEPLIEDVFLFHKMQRHETIFLSSNFSERKWFFVIQNASTENLFFLLQCAPTENYFSS